jgi:phage N-6-adenine-methyltransferase
MTVAQDKTGVGAGSMEWRTPPELFTRLNARFQFDYDAFASHENALCRQYSTMNGTFWRNEDGSWWEGSSDDGLAFDWSERRVWMNPPYSRDLIAKCVRKAVDERNKAQIIVALIPASTETMWFQQLVLPHCHIEWLPRRVRFIDPETGEPGQSPPSGSVIAIFRQDYQ